MILRFTILTLLAFVTAFLVAFRIHEPQGKITSSNQWPGKKNFQVRCGPDWEFLNEMFEEVEIPPIAGAGSYKWKITTSSDSAQFYFNQGINMYYSFHIIEAMASFKKAARFDPASAMLHWAQALALGPNINDVGYAETPNALLSIGKAIELSNKCTDKEKLLIAAQQVRYSTDSTISRATLNQLYVDKSRLAYDKYPNDADVAALYADALMLQHPWDLWRVDGTPKPWTPRIREVLEKLLKKTPGHPGANHYYIHVMEPSPYPEKALASADRLGRLTPGLSHTVHMPSHIYLRTGRYDLGTVVNENAVNSYKKVFPLYSPVATADFLYVIHNLHMQTNNSMLAGRSVYSTTAAMETMNSIPKDYLLTTGALGNYIQYIYMTPVMVDIRFGKWDDLLKREKPAASNVYANVLHLFGRGMAFAGQSKLAEARESLREMNGLLKDSSLLPPLSPFSAAIDGAMVAENLLSGTIALKEKNYGTALASFQKAVELEENMVYNEPRDWMLNPRQYLGNALLKAGRWLDAEKAFRNDMKVNNENGWALFGLSRSLDAQNRKAEAAKLYTRFMKAFAKADVKLSGPVFF
ncbi:MAG: hypothetical protein H7Y42_00555 [Chitinophagaceae bacterium]|nr:hypothetical protein [Chitinophagaceae bacterium]